MPVTIDFIQSLCMTRHLVTKLLFSKGRKKEIKTWIRFFGLKDEYIYFFCTHALPCNAFVLLVELAVPFKQFMPIG